MDTQGNYFLQWGTSPGKLLTCMLGDYGGLYDLNDLDKDNLEAAYIA